MKQPTNQSGYIGLMLILMGTALTLFLFTKLYFTPSTNATNGQVATSTTQFERMQTSIDAAKAISNQQNQKASEQNKLMEGFQ